MEDTKRKVIASRKALLEKDLETMLKISNPLNTDDWVGFYHLLNDTIKDSLLFRGQKFQSVCTSPDHRKIKRGYSFHPCCTVSGGGYINEDKSIDIEVYLKAHQLDYTTPEVIDIIYKLSASNPVTETYIFDFVEEEEDVELGDNVEF